MSKIDRIVGTISRQIGEGVIAEGTVLPSLRRAADEFGVSKNTVVEAYERLVASGLILSRRGSGFIVAPPTNSTRAHPPPHLLQAVDQISLLRAQLDQTFDVRVGDGRPPASWMSGLSPRRSFIASSDLIAESAAYGSPKGYRLLRELIVGRYHNQGISLSVEQVMTTFGANHALDLIIRRHLIPGDIVLVDDPGYYPLFAKLKLAQVRYVGVKRTPAGPDIDDLRAKIAAHRPSIFFTQALGQNPTGSSMDLSTAHALLSLADENKMLVVDDDPFVDFPNMSGVRLAALDQCRNVICVGTFSKTISASFRSGYIAGQAGIVDDLTELKMITAVNSSRFSEIIIADMIRSGRYQKHLNRIGKRILAASSSISETLSQIGLKTHSPIGQGYYAYLLLPEGVVDLEVAGLAALKGIFLAPGSVFAAGEDASRASAMRINVARADDARFFRFLSEIRSAN